MLCCLVALLLSAGFSRAIPYYVDAVSRTSSSDRRRPRRQFLTRTPPVHRRPVHDDAVRRNYAADGHTSSSSISSPKASGLLRPSPPAGDGDHISAVRASADEVVVDGAELLLRPSSSSVEDEGDLRGAENLEEDLFGVDGHGAEVMRRHCRRGLPGLLEEIFTTATPRGDGADDNSNTTCCICLADYEIDQPLFKLATTCGHRLHQDCLAEHLMGGLGRTCPLCRASPFGLGGGITAGRSSSWEQAEQVAPTAPRAAEQPEELLEQPEAEFQFVFLVADVARITAPGSWEQRLPALLGLLQRLLGLFGAAPTAPQAARPRVAPTAPRAARQPEEPLEKPPEQAEAERVFLVAYRACHQEQEERISARIRRLSPEELAREAASLVLQSDAHLKQIDAATRRLVMLCTCNQCTFTRTAFHRMPQQFRTIHAWGHDVALHHLP